MSKDAEPLADAAPGPMALDVISRSTAATALALSVILPVSVVALSAADIVRFISRCGLHQTCNHVGPGAVVILGILSLTATVLITRSVRLRLDEPTMR